jgi:general secretion pathway protein A
MYQEYFGLQESAFSIAVNPRYLYMSEQHREALAHLLFGIQNGGFVMLTGEVGTGKTTLVRCLMEQLPENTDMAMVLNPMANAPELLTIICEDFGISFVEDNLSVKNLTDVLHIFLLKNHAKGRKTLLLIDEAQLLQIPVLEQVRLLTNLETNSEKLLQIILVGQTELKELLETPELRQLSQRITARFHLTELTLDDTKAYLQHRLQVAGMKEGENPFPEEIVKLLHQHSKGIPRLINVIAERLLLGAFAKQTKVVDKAIFDQALQEVMGKKTEKPLSNSKAVTAITQGLIVLCLILIVTWWSRREPIEVKSEVSSLSNSSFSISASSVSSEISSSSVKSAVSEFLQYRLEKSAAESLLMSFSSETVFDINSPCNLQLGQNNRCQKVQLTTWNQLKDLNRPGLMTLVDENKRAFYLFVTGLSADRLLVRNHQQEKILAWNDVAPYWSGEFTFVWNSPAGFELDLQLGDQSPVVTWVAAQFARIDKQPRALTELTFTENLKKRLQLFQSSRGIEPTGLIDKPSLQQLNLILGIDKTLIVLPDVSTSQSITSSTGVI